MLLKPAFSAETQSKIINVAGAGGLMLLQAPPLFAIDAGVIQEIRYGSALRRHRRADHSALVGACAILLRACPAGRFPPRCWLSDAVLIANFSDKLSVHTSWRA